MNDSIAVEQEAPELKRLLEQMNYGNSNIAHSIDTLFGIATRLSGRTEETSPCCDPPEDNNKSAMTQLWEEKSKIENASHRLRGVISIFEKLV